MDMELLLEAEKRGLLPPDKKELLGEARRRGMVPGGDAQPTPAPGIKGSWVGGVLRGLRDIPDAGAQLVTRGLEAIAPAGSGFETWARGQRENVEGINREAEREYQQEWRGGNNDGIDWGRVGGNVLGSGPAMAAAPLGTAATALGRAAQAARAGAIGGALQPTFEDDFWKTKAAQVGLGAATAGIANPAIERVAGGAANLANTVMDKGRTVVSRLSGQDRGSDLADLVAKALHSQGVNLADLSADVQRSVLKDAQEALRTTGRLDPAALLRKSDFAALDIKPEASWVTRDPVQWSRAQNLRNVDAGRDVLAPLDAEANRGLITALGKQRGPAQGDTPYQLGDEAVRALQGRHDVAKAGVDDAYAMWRAANPNAPGNGTRFVDTLTRSLDENVVTLPSAWVTRVNKIAEGDFPVTANTLEQMRRAAGNLSKSADGNERMAGALITRAIDEEAATLAGESGSTMANAVLTGARTKAKQLFELKEAVPALRAVAEGKADPETFFQRYVLGGSVKDVAQMWLTFGKEGQAAKDAVRAQFIDHLKTKALNAASDEAGNFSPTAYRKALQSIPKEKTEILVGKRGIDELERIGRVATYAKTAPPGARFNTSGTAGELMNLLGRTTGIPFLGPIVTKPIKEGIDAAAAARLAQGDRASVAMHSQIMDPRTQELLRRYAGLLGAPAGMGAAGEATR